MALTKEAKAALFAAVQLPVPRKEREALMRRQEEWRRNRPHWLFDRPPPAKSMSPGRWALRHRRLVAKLQAGEKVSASALRYAAVRAASYEVRREIRAMYLEAYRLWEKTGVKHELDHIVPISKGGIHHPSNLRIVTRLDNQRKGARMPYPEEHKIFT